MSAVRVEAIEVPLVEPFTTCDTCGNLIEQGQGPARLLVDSVAAWVELRGTSYAIEHSSHPLGTQAEQVERAARAWRKGKLALVRQWLEQAIVDCHNNDLGFVQGHVEHALRNVRELQEAGPFRAPEPEPTLASADPDDVRYPPDLPLALQHEVETGGMTATEAARVADDETEADPWA